MIHYRFMLLFIAGFLMGQNVLAQGQVTASGIVTDASGEPLIGVAVAVEGTSIGVSTGIDGDYSFSVPQGATLQFSYVGYQTQKLKPSTNMKVVLVEDVKVLDVIDVVGVGYGTIRKQDLTGAITSVGSKDFKQGVVTSSEQILQGKVAGLTVVQGSGDPTAGAVMRLRGGSSLSGSNSPLIVVDGVANVDMNTVQVSDIVSVDVLKDASASAIYGSRGANGVIIITTNRKGSKDEVSTSAEYSGYVGVANASKKLDLLTASNWAEHNSNDLGGNTDWQDEIQQTAITQSHALTFSNSSKRGGFKGSLSYLNSDGVIITSNMERYGASVSGYTQVWDNRLTLEAGLHTTRDNYVNIDYKRVFQSTYGVNPTLPVEIDGVYQQDPLANSNYTNPVEYLNNRYNDRSRDRILIYSKAELDIWNGLKGTVNISRNHQIENNRLYVNKDAKELESSIYQIDAVGNGGRATRDFTDYMEQQFEGFLTYDKTLNSLHRMNLLAGYSYSESVGEGHGSGVYGFASDDFLYNNMEAAANKQYIYSYKNKTNLISFFGRANYSYAGKYMLTATLRFDGSSKFGENNKWGTFPSVSAAWRLSEESFLKDNTSDWLDNLKLRVGYGVTGNQGGIDPYMSLEGYGTSKTSAGIYQTIDDVKDEDGNVIGQKVRIIPIRNANPDLKWESTGQLNVGLDFQVIKNLSGTIEFYHKNTENLLYYYYVGADGVSTYDYTLMNIGNMTNTGVEFSLNATLIDNRTSGFMWNANMNLAHNKNEIVKLSDPRFEGTKFKAGLLPDIQGLSGESYTQEIKEGYSIGSFFGAKYIGKDDQGRLQYAKTNADGSVTPVLSATDADQVYLGNAMPKLTLGFGTTIYYKNIDFGINLYGLFGQKVYNGTSMDLHNIAEHANYNILEDALKNPQTPGISDYWLENASFLRIQGVTLGYTVNLSKIKMNSLRVYATVENLFVFTSYSGVDPEVSIDMNVTKELDRDKVFPGIDYYNNYPKPRTFVFGLNLKF